MSDQPTWLNTRMEQARAAHKGIKESVVEQVRVLLATHLSERGLRPAELKTLAKQLLAEVEEATTSPAQNHEN